MEADGKVYPIRVVEEHFGVNNMLWAGCVCKSKENVSPNTKISLADDSVADEDEDHEWNADSVAEDDHQAVMDPCNGVSNENGIRAISEESLSFTSPNVHVPKADHAKERRDGICTLGEKSTREAISKLERRINRAKRKIRKKKHLSEFGIKTR